MTAWSVELPSVWEPAQGASWETDWFLDGETSQVKTTPEGLVFKTGPVEGGDASHGVLWTRREFSGDVRIEFDFTRLDKNLDHTSVCLLYVHAKGKGREPFVEDIAAWKDLRKVPQMSLYFRNMKLYHVSFACTGGKDFNYVRARQYPTKGNFAVDTVIEPSYDNVDLFKPGETYRMVFEKRGTKLSLTATKDGVAHDWIWDASQFPDLNSGRIGLRQMRGRESLFANFRVTQLP
jgi:hypothetical protein